MNRMIGKLMKVPRLLLSMIFVVCSPCIFAASESSTKQESFKPQSGTLLWEEVETFTREKKIKKDTNTIYKRETTKIVDHVYGKGLTKSPYQYVSVITEMLYSKDEQHKDELARAYLHSNFRYSSKEKSAVCLSNLKSHMTNNPNYTLNIFTHATDKTGEKACGISSVKFRHKGVTIDKEHYEISCDSNGYISFGSDENKKPANSSKEEKDLIESSNDLSYRP